jgi:hypothetical protein
VKYICVGAGEVIEGPEAPGVLTPTVRPVPFVIEHSPIPGRHRLWLGLRRYLIIFDPLTFVLD